MKMPAAAGVPLIVITFAAQLADTPAGRPVGVPIPVAPAVLCVMAAIGMLMHRVGVDDAGPAEQEITLMVPVNPPQLAV